MSDAGHLGLRLVYTAQQAGEPLIGAQSVQAGIEPQSGRPVAALLHGQVEPARPRSVGPATAPPGSTGALLHPRRPRPGSETAGMRTRRPRPAPAVRSAFAGFRFPPDVIVLAVRWYLRFGLSYRDVEELLAERGIEVDHVTIYRWVLRFTPLLPRLPDRADTPSVTAGRWMRPT
jgi:hypothetical protein